MKIRYSRHICVAGGLLVASMVFAGCAVSQRSDYAQTEKIRSNLTPNLDTLHQRPDDIANALTIMADENGRMFWQDLGRALYVDRPSRLTREPVPW